MKLIIKLFPEIFIKKKPVRLRFIKILTNNIRNILKKHDISVVVIRHWDYIEVHADNKHFYPQLSDFLTRIPGIHHILLVKEHAWQSIHDIYLKTLSIYQERLVGKDFCVRVKRDGNHNFTSQELECYIGNGLNKNVDNTHVNLKNPDEIVMLEIKKNRLFIIIKRFEGISGFPIGTQEDVLSLISGGFDSSVSSYMLMRRGCKVHYCFFNLGGSMHEVSVLQTTYHLWYNYGISHKVRFISIDFIPIINEILIKINNRYMSVVLKRMMIRIASAVAEYYGIQALVTGESLGQVSSQTLSNLRLIDNVSNILVLRPLISYDKEKIIKLARQIGTEQFVKNIEEYCGIISNNPTTQAKKNRIEQEETKFDFTILTKTVEKMQILDIHKITSINNKTIDSFLSIEITTKLSSEDVLLDIRSQNEQESRPLIIENIMIKRLPFYKLNTQFNKLDQTKSYLLYCDCGIMSHLQARYLFERGFRNIKIYRPTHNLK